MRVRFLAAVVTISVLTLMAASSAQARNVHYSGAAPGSVSCSLTVTVAFKPAMTNSVASTKVTAKGTFSQCTPSDSAVTVSGKLTSAGQGGDVTAFTQSPLNCSSSPSSGSNFTISWKGTFNGSVGDQTFSGRAKYFGTTVEPAQSTPGETESSNGSGDAGITLPADAVTAGSFQANTPTPPTASGSLYTQYSAAQISSMCTAGGVKSLTFTGSVSLGT